MRLARIAGVIALAATSGAAAGCHRRHAGSGRAVRIGPRPINLSMVAIPAGQFAMGSNDGDSDERPVHRTTVDAFLMQRTLVTVAEYRQCEEAKACASTQDKPFCNEHIPGRDRHPINCVTWNDARAFCEWAGARLPTEEEWEYAARGTDGRRYPWGNDVPARQLCWDGQGSELGKMQRRGTCSVESHPSGASPFGLLDMAGNLWQWTSDLASEDYDERRVGPKRIVRGGTWYGYDAQDVRSTLRFREREGLVDYGTGFRCAN